MKQALKFEELSMVNLTYVLKHKDNFKNTHLGWIGEGQHKHS